MIYKILKENLDYLFILIASGLIIYKIIPYTDINEHINHVIRINLGQREYPPNFLFYFLVNTLSILKSEKIFFKFSAALILSLSCLSKYFISKNIIFQNNTFFFGRLSNKKLIILSLCLFFSFSIPDFYSIYKLNLAYLSRIPPNIWHNSTTLLLIPFALLLFSEHVKILNQGFKPDNNFIIKSNLLVFLNIITKPSFIFTFIPVTAIIILINIRKYQFYDLLKIFSPIVTSIILLFIQYYLIYVLHIGNFESKNSYVEFIFPFSSYFVPDFYIPILFVFSFSLPISILIFYPDLIKSKSFLYSIALSAFGILISAFVGESGLRQSHGNFMWQNIICAYLIFLSVFSFLASKLIKGLVWRWREYSTLFLIILHVASGFFYIFRLLVERNYF